MICESLVPVFAPSNAIHTKASTFSPARPPFPFPNPKIHNSFLLDVQTIRPRNALPAKRPYLKSALFQRVAIQLWTDHPLHDVATLPRQLRGDNHRLQPLQTQHRQQRPPHSNSSGLRLALLRPVPPRSRHHRRHGPPQTRVFHRRRRRRRDVCSGLRRLSARVHHEDP